MNMLVVIHVMIALASLLVATMCAVAPSRSKLHVNRGLILATFASGTWLVVQTHSPVLGACTSGLLYLAVAATLTLVAHHRFDGNQ